MEDLIKQVFDKIFWVVIPILGGALYGGLLSRLRFRKEYKRQKMSLITIQNLYNTLCWNKHKPSGFEVEGCSYQQMGQFCWDDLRTPTKLSLFSYNTNDRSALRSFLKFESDFTSLNDVFKLPVEEAIEKVADMAITHFYCMEIMYNFGNLATNNSKSCKRFKFISNTREAFKLYSVKYNKHCSLEDNSDLMKLLKQCSPEPN